MRCETSHDSCAVADVDVSSLMSDIENELRWISLFRLFFMFVWSVSVWASISLSSQCVDARSAIETTHVHRQSFCLLLHFWILLRVLSFNVTLAWFLEIECSHVQSEFFADVSDLLLMSWLSLFSERSDCHCMLRVCRDWIGFSSQQALGVLAYVEPLASTLYPSASDTRANLLRPLCFALL